MKKRKRLLFLVASIVFVAACAPIRPHKLSYQKGRHPEPNVRSTATVGQVMVEQYDYWSRSAALPLEDIKGSFWLGRKSIGAGTKLTQISASDKTMYCAPPLGYGAACLADTDNDRRFDQTGTVNAYNAVVNHTTIDNPIPYKLITEITSEMQGAKYELVYQGVSGNVVQIVYREYNQDLARPAYRQDLTYTLKEGGDTEVSFRDLRIVIHAAGNNAIEYTVKSGL